MSRASTAAKGTAGVLVFVLLWESLRAVGVLPREWAPSVPAIAEACWRGLTDGSLTTALSDTLTAWLIGLAIATAVGFLWGTAIGSVPIIAACSRIVVRFLRPVPSVALIPVAILAAGLGLQMVLILVVFASVWPVLFNTVYASREVPEQYRDTARTLGWSPLAIQIRVVGVAVLPGVVTGIRVAAGIALVVTVSAELITGIGGLGGYILEARISGRIPEAYAALVIGGALGVAVNMIFSFLQRRFLAWSPDNRRAS